MTDLVWLAGWFGILAALAFVADHLSPRIVAWIEQHITQ